MNKLHPQELADLLQCWVTWDMNGWAIHQYKPLPNNVIQRWYCQGIESRFRVTHVIAKPDDCLEWDKAIWEPRVRPERGQLCLFSHNKSGLTIEEAHIGYFDIISDGYFCDTIGDSWSYCKPIESVPLRIDLDAQRGE